MFLMWEPGPPGCYHTVYLRNDLTGHEWQLYSGLAPGCSVPLKLLMDSAPLSYEIQVQEPAGGQHRTLLGYQRLPTLGPDEHTEYIGAILIGVPEDTVGDRHRLVVRESKSREDIHDIKSPERSFRIQMQELRAGACYSARLFSRYRDVWAPSSSWWEFRAGGEIGCASTAHVVEGLFNELTGQDKADAMEAILDFTSDDDERPAHLAHLARLVFRAWKHCCTNPNELDASKLQGVARRAAALDRPSSHVCTSLDYLSLWTDASACFRHRGLQSLNYWDLSARRGDLAAVRSTIEVRSSSLYTTYGTLMFDGMLTSVHDRPAAMSLFQAARSQYPEFNEALYLDQYASTYLSTEAIDAGAAEIDKRRTLLAEDVQMLTDLSPDKKPRTLLLFSCDAEFFKIYFPYWASTIDSLVRQNVALHFVLTADDQAATAAFEDGLAIVDAIVRLRNLDVDVISRALSFSHVKTPEYVTDDHTFHACARYLLARDIQRQSGGRVFILDMDMVLANDPAEFLRESELISESKFPIVLGGGLGSLIPARRYMAGICRVVSGEFCERIMRWIEDYIYLGLSRSPSWTLDQNALTYAAERMSGVFGLESMLDLKASIKSPFVQLPVRQLYENESRQHRQGI